MTFGNIMFALKNFLLTPQMLYCYRVQFQRVMQKWELKTQLVSVFVCVCVFVTFSDFESD